MAVANANDVFFTLLDKLREVHLGELETLRAEIERLQSRLWVLDGPGGSAIEQYIADDVASSSSNSAQKDPTSNGIAVAGAEITASQDEQAKEPNADGAWAAKYGNWAAMLTQQPTCPPDEAEHLPVPTEPGESRNGAGGGEAQLGQQLLMQRLGVVRAPARTAAPSQPLAPTACLNVSIGDRISSAIRSPRTPETSVLPPAPEETAVEKLQSESDDDEASNKHSAHHHDRGQQSNITQGTGSHAKDLSGGNKKAGSRRNPSSPFITRNSTRETPQEGTTRAALYHFVKSAKFEAAFAFCIVCNAIVVAVEAQHRGIDTGYNLSYPKSHTSADNAWPGAKEVFEFLGHIFGAVFAFEVVVKMIALRFKWVSDAWNWFDLTIVLFWLIDYAVDNGDSTSLPVNEQLLRVARLVRLLRLMRLVKTIQGIDSLMLMTTALMGSVEVLIWSVFLLLIVQATLALLVNQILTEFYFPEVHPEDQLHAVYEYFGTFTRAMLTMFEMTLANWPPVCRLMAENVTEWWMLFALVHKLTIGFAVVGIINGVFMQETFKAASTDDRIMVRQRQRIVETHRKKMEHLFAVADLSGRGTLNKEEFTEIMQNKDVCAWMASMELDTKDVDALFSLIDDGDEQVEVDELINGVAKLKGTARRFDLAILMRDHKQLMIEHAALWKGLDAILGGCLSHLSREEQSARRSRLSAAKASRSLEGRSKLQASATSEMPPILRLMSEPL